MPATHAANQWPAQPAGVNIKRDKQIAKQAKLLFTFLGGDPAAPSGTATLLRLSASYQAYPRYRVERQL